MSDSMKSELSSHHRPEISVSKISARADIAVSNAVNKLQERKGKQVKGKISAWQRAFVSLAVPAASFLAACGWGDQQNLPPIPESTPISRTYVPTETTTSTIEHARIPPALTTETDPLTSNEFPAQTHSPELEYQDMLGIKFAFDKQSGIPAKYVLENGKEVVFDIEKVKKIRENATISGEPEIITMINVGSANQNNEFNLKRDNNYTIDHPQTTELPADVLSEEELMEKGVTIFQSEHITKLHIRKGAFEKDGPLADFNHTGRKLNILLLDGSIIDQKYLNDPKYAEAVSQIPQEHRSVKDRREVLIRNAETKMREMRKKNNDHTPDPFLEHDFLAYKEIVYRYQNLMSDDQIQQEKYSDSAVGNYFRSKENPSIIIALGGKQFNYLVIYAEPRGFGASSLIKDSLTTVAARVDQNQTYPNPADFVIDPSATSTNQKYAYMQQAGVVGFLLGHEAAHDELVQQNINRGERPNNSEYDTDMKAMERIRQAWNTWQMSNFTDNSRYYFVFGLPEGGYILTENKQLNTKTPSGT